MDLYLDSELDGGSYSSNKGEGVGEIVVGWWGYEWCRVVGFLLHEALECALAQVRARYLPDTLYTQASDTYLFYCDHNQYSEAVARVGDFLAECLLPLQKKYNELNRRRR